MPLSTPTTPHEIAAFITRRDRAFGPLVRSVGSPPARRASRIDQRFTSLARTITYQMLAGAAADVIHARVVELCHGTVTPSHLLALDETQLRGAGLSGSKARALRELARLVDDDTIHLRRHGRMSDDEVTGELTAVRGVGPWTAEMYLLFTLARPDVWPVKDLAVRAGWSALHNLDEPIDEKALRTAGESFAGVRSSVAWYCWRAVEQRRAAK